MALTTRLPSVLLLALLVLCIQLGEATKSDPAPRAEDNNLSQDAINALWQNWHPSRERQDLINTNETESTLRQRDSSARVTEAELETAMCESKGKVGFERRFLWSGWDADTCTTYDKSQSVETPAGNLAAKLESTTLESALSKMDITMPDFTERDEEAQDLWKYASRRYAQCATDYVVFYKGKCTRANNVFVTIELPTLQAEDSKVDCVFQVTTADPYTPTTYWVRDGKEPECESALDELTNCDLAGISV